MSTARRIPTAATAGLVLVAVVRALTVPRSLWELDEALFARAIQDFDPLTHRPHPPGYPLLVGLGKLLNLIFHDPFTSLVALAVVSSLVGYAALVAAFRRIDGSPEGERTAVVGALLFQLSPVLLVQGSLPMSDPPALLFIALALWAGACLEGGGSRGAALGLGAAASAAIGCRPQLALCVLPLLAVALARAPGWRRRSEALGAFTLVSLLWFVPLVVETGGWQGFVGYQLHQASYVAAHDASTSRGGRALFHVAAVFIAHPWGPKLLAVPVLLLASVGAVRLRRRLGAALPLLALGGAQLLVCLLVMDPADGARYALPAVLAVAFLAAQGLPRRPALVWGMAGLLFLGFATYAWPVLAARFTTPAPPTQAADWIRGQLPRKSMILVTHDLEAQASYLLAGQDLSPVEIGLSRAARRPWAPLYLLAEGESAWPGAITFRWPDSDAYRRLTRNHYRVVSLSPIPPGWRFERLRGIHGWEPSDREARWRWLEPDAALKLFPRGSRTVTLKLGLDAAVPLPSNRVTLSVGGLAVSSVEIPRGGERAIEIPLPSAKPVALEIRSDSSFVAPDGRRLAVQLLALDRVPAKLR